LTFKVTAPSVVQPVFQDATASAGLSSTTIPRGSYGHFTNGAAWADVNGDGYPDLAVARGSAPIRLFINDRHGHFRDEAATRGIDDGGEWALGVVFADFDNNGAPDLLILNDGPNRLL